MVRRGSCGGCWYWCCCCWWSHTSSGGGGVVGGRGCSSCGCSCGWCSCNTCCCCASNACWSRSCCSSSASAERPLRLLLAPCINCRAPSTARFARCSERFNLLLSFVGPAALLLLVLLLPPRRSRSTAYIQAKHACIQTPHVRHVLPASTCTCKNSRCTFRLRRRFSFWLPVGMAPPAPSAGGFEALGVAPNFNFLKRACCVVHCMKP